jgi:hypothetical protein
MAEKTNTYRTTKERKWRWIIQTLIKPQGAIERQALAWNPLGTRKRGTSTPILSVSLLSLPGEF